MLYIWLVLVLFTGNALYAVAGGQATPSRSQSQQQCDEDEMESVYGDDSGAGEVDADIIIEDDVDSNDDEGVTD